MLPFERQGETCSDWKADAEVYAVDYVSVRGWAYRSVPTSPVVKELRGTSFKTTGQEATYDDLY